MDHVNQEPDPSHRKYPPRGPTVPGGIGIKLAGNGSRLKGKVSNFLRQLSTGKEDSELSKDIFERTTSKKRFDLFASRPSSACFTDASEDGTECDNAVATEKFDAICVVHVTETNKHVPGEKKASSATDSELSLALISPRGVVEESIRSELDSQVRSSPDIDFPNGEHDDESRLIVRENYQLQNEEPTNNLSVSTLTKDLQIQHDGPDRRNPTWRRGCENADDDFFFTEDSPHDQLSMENKICRNEVWGTKVEVSESNSISIDDRSFEDHNLDRAIDPFVSIHSAEPESGLVFKRLDSDPSSRGFLSVDSTSFSQQVDSWFIVPDSGGEHHRDPSFLAGDASLRGYVIPSADYDTDNGVPGIIPTDKVTEPKVGLFSNRDSSNGSEYGEKTSDSENHQAIGLSEDKSTQPKNNPLIEDEGPQANNAQENRNYLSSADDLETADFFVPGDDFVNPEDQIISVENDSHFKENNSMHEAVPGTSPTNTEESYHICNVTTSVSSARSISVNFSRAEASTSNEVLPAFCREDIIDDRKGSSADDDRARHFLNRRKTIGQEIERKGVISRAVSFFLYLTNMLFFASGEGAHFFSITVHRLLEWKRKILETAPVSDYASESEHPPHITTDIRNAEEPPMQQGFAIPEHVQREIAHFNLVENSPEIFTRVANSPRMEYQFVEERNKAKPKSIEAQDSIDEKCVKEVGGTLSHDNAHDSFSGMKNRDQSSDASAPLVRKKDASEAVPESAEKGGDSSDSAEAIVPLEVSDNSDRRSNSSPEKQPLDLDSRPNNKNDDTTTTRKLSALGKKGQNVTTSFRMLSLKKLKSKTSFSKSRDEERDSKKILPKNSSSGRLSSSEELASHDSNRTGKSSESLKSGDKLKRLSIGWLKSHTRPDNTEVLTPTNATESFRQRALDDEAADKQKPAKAKVTSPSQVGEAIKKAPKVILKSLGSMMHKDTEDTRFASPRSAKKTATIISDLLTNEMNVICSVKKGGPFRLQASKDFDVTTRIRAKIEIEPMDDFSSSAVFSRDKGDKCAGHQFIDFVNEVHQHFLIKTSQGKPSGSPSVIARRCFQEPDIA